MGMPKTNLQEFLKEMKQGDDRWIALLMSRITNNRFHGICWNVKLISLY
ncbi:hypothetical protein FHW89_003631 [Mucilaginibacter sp. SG564]|nr:hypothetical protein [Mucilaginibacter sp. SG564]